MKPRLRKCATCRVPFMPRQSFQTACSVPCAIEAGKANAKRQARAEKVAGRKRLMTRRDHLKVAQAAFNAWVRRRDAGRPCIACGRDSTGSVRYAEGQRHASHYRSVGACPELRFNEDNVHSACSKCNTQLSGNIVAYRIGLLAKIGPERLAALEGPHPPLKLTLEEIQALTAKYRRMAVDLL